MAKENDSALSEVKVKDAASPVERVAVPENPSAKYWQEQNEALAHYKVTGEVGAYIDPSRDQEPDIAPEFGVAPHPELANPAPPEGSFSAVAANSPVVADVEDKEEAGDEAVSEAVAAREEAAKDADEDGNALPAAPVSAAPKSSDAAPANKQ